MTKLASRKKGSRFLFIAVCIESFAEEAYIRFFHRAYQDTSVEESIEMFTTCFRQQQAGMASCQIRRI